MVVLLTTSAIIYCLNFVADTVPARLKVLYTDYEYALVYECAQVSPLTNRCLPDQSQTVLYGRRKTSHMHIPEEILAKISDVANEACIYLEDFTPAFLPNGL
jgi:hypothetical protein